MENSRLEVASTWHSEQRVKTTNRGLRFKERIEEHHKSQGRGVSDRSVGLGGQLKKKGASSTLLQTCSYMEWEGNADILSRQWSRQPWQENLETLPIELVTNPIWGSRETVVPPMERRSLSYRAMARLTGFIFKENPLFKTELHWWSDNK